MPTIDFRTFDGDQCLRTFDQFLQRTITPNGGRKQK